MRWSALLYFKVSRACGSCFKVTWAEAVAIFQSFTLHSIKVLSTSLFYRPKGGSNRSQASCSKLKASLNNALTIPCLSYAYLSAFFRSSLGEVPMKFLWGSYEVPIETRGKQEANQRFYLLAIFPLSSRKALVRACIRIHHKPTNDSTQNAQSFMVKYVLIPISPPNQSKSNYRTHYTSSTDIRTPKYTKEATDHSSPL